MTFLTVVHGRRGAVAWCWMSAGLGQNLAGTGLKTMAYL